MSREKKKTINRLDLITMWVVLFACLCAESFSTSFALLGVALILTAIKARTKKKYRRESTKC